MRVGEFSWTVVLLGLFFGACASSSSSDSSKDDPGSALSSSQSDGGNSSSSSSGGTTTAHFGGANPTGKPSDGAGGTTSTASGGSDPSAPVCTNDCFYAHDGECDDSGPGSDYGARLALCFMGTDCADCGPRNPDDIPVPSPTVDAACSSEPAGRNVGDLAEDFTLLDQSGNTVSLSDYCGKVVYLHLGAMWCPACRSVAKGLQAFQDKYADQGLVVLDVMTETVHQESPTTADLAVWADTYHLTLPVLADPDWDFWHRYWPGYFTPRELLIGRDGRLILTQEVSESDVKKALSAPSP